MTITSVIRVISPTLVTGPKPSGSFEGWGVRIG